VVVLAAEPVVVLAAEPVVAGLVGVVLVEPAVVLVEPAVVLVEPAGGLVGLVVGLVEPVAAEQVAEVLAVAVLVGAVPAAEKP
jgi:hypothetical protein